MRFYRELKGTYCRSHLLENDDTIFVFQMRSQDRQRPVRRASGSVFEVEAEGRIAITNSGDRNWVVSGPA